MFRQRFRWMDGSIVEIEWHEPRDGYIAIDWAAGKPSGELTDAEYRYAYGACHSRMAEYGEHKDEPRTAP